MQKMLLTLVLAAAVCGAAPAADSNPPLLCDAGAPAPAGGACPPPPPVCPPPPPVCAPPPPVCPPPPPVCAPKPEVCKVIEVPVKTCVNEVRTVTVKKKVWDEECYTAEEKRTEVVNEVRTRTARRQVPVTVAKEVSEAKIVTVKDPGYGSVPRLARGVNRKIVPVTRMQTEEYEETYLQPVRHTVSVPVVKTRKVAREVEEVQTITVPVTVTTMETRVVSSR